MEFQNYLYVIKFIKDLSNYFDLFPEHYKFKGIFRVAGSKEKEDLFYK